ncbi:MAG TPA: ParB/RepB/Spo0J family partition protein [Ignavibacteriaceae bacterium]|nr:ParB/RepB/Spo0J family partition protein [Ignavibacteriaceae bacterium]
MTKLKPGLGRGLDALIRPQNFPSNKEEVPDYTNVKKDDGKETNILAKIPVDLISSNPYQPRKNFEPEAQEELKKSILSNGLIQPITVRRIPDNRYQLISGERRLKACIEIGYRDIPAYILQVDKEETMLAMALIENIQREKLNPIEIGQAYKRLMEECSLTQEEIAETVGKDRTTVANSIRLLKLPEEIQDALVKEEITSGHARALINLPTESLQLEMLGKIKDANLSVRKVEQLVKKYLTGEGTPYKLKKITRQIPKSANMKDVEDRLRKLFATKVICRQKQDGSGEITIEFYSSDELERLFELFDAIEKSYS